MNNIRKIMRSLFRKIMCLALAWAAPAAMAATNIWQGGVSSDFNAPDNWSLSALDVADISTFTGAAAVQPNVTTDITVTQVNFLIDAINYNLSSAASATLTLSGAVPIKGLNTSGTNTVSAKLILSGGGTKSIQQAGNGTLVVSGNISESTPGTAVKYERVSVAFGKYIITGQNSYSGETTFVDGTFSVPSFGMSGSVSSIGKSGIVNLGSSDSSRDATLVYMGSGETSDKIIKVGAGSGARSISTLGATGGLILSADLAMSGTAALPKLTFSGDSAGNVFGGKIMDPSATTTTTVTKAGTGAWTFGGANTYKGTTTLNSSGGTLLINGNQSAATGNVVVNSGATLGGKGVVGGSTTILSGGKLAAGLATGSPKFNGNLALNAGATAIFEGVVPVNVAGQLSLVNNWTLKLGSGFKNGGSVTLFTYSTLASSPDLVPTFDTTALGFTPSASLSLTDTGSSIVLNGVKLPPSGTTILSIR